VRVLIVVNGLGTGGTERSLAEMLPGYAQRGVNAIVACFYRRDEGVQDGVIAAGHDVRFIEEKSVPTRARALRRLVEEERVDLIHTQLFDANMAGRLAGVGLEAPVLTSLVSISYEPIRSTDPNISRHKLRVVRAVDGWTSRHLTNHFHAVSHAVKDAAVRALGIDPSRVTVVERGRDARRLGEPSFERRTTVREALGIDPDAPVLITAGRQEYVKGHVYLLEAMAELRTRVPGVLLLLAGRRGNASEELDTVYERLGLGDTVRLLGHRDDVPDLLAASDIFVLPSLIEGIAGAVIEAMALGLPVVASDIPSTREVLDPGGNALLVTPQQPTDLADAVATLLGDHPMMERFAEASRHRFEERFTLDRIVDRMVAMYGNVIEGNLSS